MFKCECGFESKSKAGLAAHKRRCKVEKEVEEVVEEMKESDLDIFDIVDNSGNIIRTYSRKDHGENAEKLATMFTNKFKKTYVKIRR